MPTNLGGKRHQHWEAAVIRKSLPDTELSELLRECADVGMGRYKQKLRDGEFKNEAAERAFLHDLQQYLDELSEYHGGKRGRIVVYKQGYRLPPELCN